MRAHDKWNTFMIEYQSILNFLVLLVSLCNIDCELLFISFIVSIQREKRRIKIHVDF